MAQKLLKLCFYLLFCVTPFVFAKYNSELFEFNKMFFVYGLTIIAGGTWIIKMVSQQKLIFKRTPLDYPLGLFLLSQIISTIFSIDPHTSIWGYYSRSNGGLLSVISYIILYYIFVSNFAKEDIIKFLKGAVIAGFFISLYAIPEHFGWSPSCTILQSEFQPLSLVFDANCWVQDVQARVFGTIGQPNWLAAYLAMLIFPAIFLFITAKSFLSKYAYLLITIALYAAFTFTYSRGATLGLIAGLVIMGIAVVKNFIESKNSSQLKFFSLTVLALIILNVIFGSALNDFRLLQNAAVPVRPDFTTQSQIPSGTQLENGGTESGQIRLIVWKGALDIFKAFPLFGSGVETFAYAYYQYRPVEHNLVSEWDFLYNKAHNEYLNYLATTGIFGFVTYMAMILVFIVWSIRYTVFSKDKSQHTTYYLLPTSLLAGYTSYLIQNFFLFSVVIVAVFFYLFPALSFVFAQSPKELSENNFFARLFGKIFNLIAGKNIPRKVTQALIIIIILLGVNSLYSYWEADTFYKRGSDYNDIGNPGRAYNYLIEAVGLNSSEPLYLSELGNAAASSAIALSSEDATTAGELKDDSVFFTDLGLSISPTNTTILRTAIRTFFQLSLIDPSFEAKTLETVDQSIKLAPTDPKLLVNKAVIADQFKNPDLAIEALKKAIELKPNYREARLQLADLYIKQDKKDLAKEQIDTVLKLIPNDPDALKLQEQL